MSRRNREHDSQESGSATLETQAERVPCVGLPVQYGTQDGPIPAILQRPSRVDPDLWDVRIFPNGSALSVIRAGVRHAEECQSGHWNFLPE